MITNDVLKFRTARDSTELALDAARSNSERASATLGIMIGEPNQPDLDIADIPGIPPRPTGDLAQSPVMQAAQRAIASANSQIVAAKAERLPTFQVAFTTGFVGIDPPKTISHNFGGSYDGVVSLPIFDGGLIASHIDQAQAKAHSATAQARQTEYILKRRVADASLRYDEANRQLDILVARAADRGRQLQADLVALPWRRIRDDARGAGLLSVGRAIAAPALRPAIQRARSGGGDQLALRPRPVMKRADSNCRASRSLAAAMATVLLAGCGGGKKADDEDSQAGQSDAAGERRPRRSASDDERAPAARQDGRDASRNHPRADCGARDRE